MTTSSKQIKIHVNKKVLLSNKWGLFTQMQYLPKLGKLLAVPLGFIIGASSSGDDTQLQNAIPSALFMLFQEMEDENHRDLIEGLLHDVHAENGSRKVNIDTDFEDLDEFFIVLSKVIEQQYGSLISGNGARGLFGLLLPLQQAQSQ
jgi:hypothetical protein